MQSFDAFSWNLLLAAAAIAVTHTLLGPDHYLPFIMLARAGRWSRSKTLVVTTLCGIGHILSSLLLGLIGLALGVAVAHIQQAEGARGDWAAWGLVAFGGAYLLWGLRHAIRHGKGLAPHLHGQHVHLHTHGDRTHEHEDPLRAQGSQMHEHPDPRHTHSDELIAPAGPPSRSTPAEDSERRRTITFWSLFAVFVLGPCEPLIPLFVLPASRGRWSLALVTGLFFGAITVALMITVTMLGQAGLDRIPFGRMERWSHAMAGGVIALSGVVILALGL